jgi:hypothetical protein
VYGKRCDGWQIIKFEKSADATTTQTSCARINDVAKTVMVEKKERYKSHSLFVYLDVVAMRVYSLATGPVIYIFWHHAAMTSAGQTEYVSSS